MNRTKQWAALDLQASDDPSTPLISATAWDLVIIGGGATGLGTAVDAASRGLKTLLLERDDFGKGTSSRSTKLVHGGVRYLAQGNIKLVREALRERAHLLQNAPHLSHTQSFVIPAYTWFDRYFYYFGLLCYDLLAGKLSLGATKLLNRRQTLEVLPALAGAMSGAKAKQASTKANGKKLKGGILYTDGQFDDARLCVELAATAIAQGATILNAVAVKDLIKDEKGKIVGVVAVNEINHNFPA
ncbi:MAG: FAD-dependent oxidoreductase, partial [Flavobacteriia bacterium]